MRGQYPNSLSPHWQAEAILNKVKRLPIPLWVVALCVVFFGMLAYLGFSWLLGGSSDKLFSNIVRVQPPRMQIQAPVVQRSIAVPDRLATFLAPEIRENLLTVRDEADRSVVVLRGDGLFESGSTVRQQYLLFYIVWLMLKWHSWCDLVTGYSDNVPIRTVQFRRIGSFPKPVPTQ